MSHLFVVDKKAYYRTSMSWMQILQGTGILTSRNGSLAASSNLLSGPSSTVNPFHQNVIVWNTGSVTARVPGPPADPDGDSCSCRCDSPFNVREAPTNTPLWLAAAMGWGGSVTPSWAPNRLTRSNIASTSRAPRFVGSWTIIPLQMQFPMSLSRWFIHHPEMYDMTTPERPRAIYADSQNIQTNLKLTTAEYNYQIRIIFPNECQMGGLNK